MKISDKLAEFLKSILQKSKKDNDKAKVDRSFNNNEMSGNSLCSNNTKNSYNNTYNNITNNYYCNDSKKDDVIIQDKKIHWFLQVILFLFFYSSLLLAIVGVAISVVRKDIIVTFIQDYKLIISLFFCTSLIITNVIDVKLNKNNNLNILLRIFICICPFAILLNDYLYTDVRKLYLITYFLLISGLVFLAFLLKISIESIFIKSKYDSIMLLLISVISSIFTSAYFLNLIKWIDSGLRNSADYFNSLIP